MTNFVFHNFGVTPLAVAQSGNPGAAVVYTLQITNTGNTPDMFTVGVTHAWPTAAPTTIGPLAAGASVSANFTVTVPANALSGASDIAAVTFTSQSVPSQTISSTLTTTANTVYGLALSPPTAAKTSEPDTNVFYTLQITNTSNISSIVNLSVAGNVWPVTVPLPFTLNVGASQIFTTQVTIPATATNYMTDTVTLTAIVQANPATMANATLTTTALKYQFVYLPLVQK